MDIEESNLSEDQRKLLNDMFHRHVGAFSRDDDDLGYIDNVKHEIRLTDKKNQSGFLIDEYHPISNRKFDNIWRVGCGKALFGRITAHGHFKLFSEEEDWGSRNMC